jgi:hypothetical protein
LGVEENGCVTFRIEGPSKGQHNRERRAALARASGLLHQLTASLKPLAAEGESPELTEALRVLSGWLEAERERSDPVLALGPRAP